MSAIQQMLLAWTAPKTYATWDPATSYSWLSLSWWNLTVTESSWVTWYTALATISKTTWKWYWEYVVNSWSDQIIWMASPTFNASWVALIWQQQYSCGYRQSNWDKSFFDSVWQITSYWSSYSTWNVIWVAIDFDAGTTIFYKNNVSQWTAYSIPANTSITAAVSIKWGNMTANFWATALTYSPPSWYNAWLYS